MISDILAAISNDKSLAIFKSIALSPGNSDIIISKLGISRKQYYSRMAVLTNAGLVERINGKYSLTSFGQIVYEAHILIGRAMRNFWKLKAIDSIESSGQVSAIEERRKIINSLLIDNDLKEILGRKKDKDNEQELVA